MLRADVVEGARLLSFFVFSRSAGLALARQRGLVGVDSWNPRLGAALELLRNSQGFALRPALRTELGPPCDETWESLTAWLQAGVPPDPLDSSWLS